jgi:Mce-associated membrane protein
MTVLAIAGIGGAAWFGTQWADLHAVERDREAVRSAATQVALRLTTFEGENIEEWLAAAREQATGDYDQQLVDVFDQRSRDSLRTIKVVSRGEIESLFVQDVDQDTASVFAVVKQTYVNVRTPDPVEDQLRVDMTLERVEDRWLASEVAVLGPAGVLAPTGESDAGGDE